MNIYIAGPLFTSAEISFNLVLKEKLYNKLNEYYNNININLPQESCELALENAIKQNDGKELSSQKQFDVIYNECIKGVQSCGILIAILDGPDPDSGTCFEVGYAKALGKKIICVRNDFRIGGEPDNLYNVNLMLWKENEFVLCNPLTESINDLVEKIYKKLRIIS